MDWLKNFFGDLYKAFAVVIIILIMFYLFLPDNHLVNNLLSLAAIIAFPLSLADMCATAYDLSKKSNRPNYMKFFYILYWVSTITSFGMFFWLIYELTSFGWFNQFYKDNAFVVTSFSSLATALFLYTLACKRELELMTNKGPGRLVDLSSVLILTIIIFTIISLVKYN